MYKKMIENYTNAVWNKKNLAVIWDLFSDEAVIHSPLGKFQSPQEMSKIITQWITAFPDLQVELLHTLEDHDLVVSHWKTEGTHQKELNGIEAKGNPVAYQGVALYRFKKNKVVEYWAFLDSETLEKQMKHS